MGFGEIEARSGVFVNKYMVLRFTKRGLFSMAAEKNSKTLFFLLRIGTWVGFEFLSST